MSNYRHLLTLILIACFGFTSQAQLDIHFSQFYQSPTNLNPALTGVMNCNIRLSANYRNQWSSVTTFDNSFNTFSASYDQKIPTGRYDYFGVGATFWGDVAGTSNFSTITGKLSGSYSKRMGGYREKAHYLVMGAEVGFAQRNIDLLALRWGTQHDGQGGFDATAPTFEDDFVTDNFNILDLAVGLLWFSIIDRDNNFYIGGAYSHLNRDNISFTQGGASELDVPLYTKVTLHAGGQFGIADRMSLIPNIVTFFQGPSWQLVPGTALRFKLGSRRSQQSFQLGAWARITHKLDDQTHLDALVLAARFGYEDFSIGFSYDLNISDLSTASNFNGAFEFSFQYLICGPEKRNVYCPNF